MPPKPKYTADEIAEAALLMVKEEGLSALTARELGVRLGTSSRPLFTAFRNMDEVKQAARRKALTEFRAYIGDYRKYSPPLKRIGMLVVRYAQEEPEVFRLMFMQEHRERGSVIGSLFDMGDLAEDCLRLAREDYRLTEQEAVLLMEQMWVAAYGLGSMCALGICDMTEDEIGHRLAMTFAGNMTLIKTGKLREISGDVTCERDTYHGNSLHEFSFLPKEVSMVRLVDRPDLKTKLAAWNSEKWGIPESAYRESMDECLSGGAVPQWYAALTGDRIVGGLGVIENDFHDRKDLTPNVCAVYVEEDFRGRGIAGQLLDLAVRDMAERGIPTLYLVTDHTSFYERYGWRFFTGVREESGGTARLYIHENGRTKA